MQRNFIILVLACVIFGCNGHLPSLTGILSGAHKHVHDTVSGVANTVFGGFNFDGQVQVGGQSRPQRPPPNKEPETVVVIVDQRPDNNYDPRPHNQPNQGYGQNNGYNNRPPYGHGGQNHYGHGQPWQNQNGNYNHDSSNGPYGHNQNNFGQNPNNYGNYGNQNGYGQHQHGNHNDYNRPEQTPNEYGNPNNGYNQGPTGQTPENNNENNGYTNQNNYGQTKPPTHVETRPTLGSIHENEGNTQKPFKNDKTTPKSDEPLFVPLHPNEYVYGGDKINVTSPKRDTDDTKQSSNNDEDLPIDIRFQDN